MGTKFQFDDAKLAALQQQVPPNLQILRLRLRFGLPQMLALGQRFRVSVELVDEMGQPATVSQELRSELKLRISHETSSSSSGAGAELKTKQLAVNLTKFSSCTWHFDAEFSPKANKSNQRQDEHVEELELDWSSVDATILLQIQSMRLEADNKTEFHRAFQRFCLHSTWIDAETLVLPLQSQTIRLQLPSPLHRDIVNPVQSSLVNKNLVTSNLCSRVFSISSCPLTSSKRLPESPAQGKVIVIQENYGDTMGSHIWDASILLSFAHYKAGQFVRKQCEQHCQQEQRDPHVILELGAGCGLFATVYATLCELSSPPIENQDMVLTERAESLDLLQANLRLNDHSVNSGSGKAERKQIHFLPLVWGNPIDSKLNIPRVDTIFAADVLYNWTAHESLLRTIDEIVYHRRGGGSELQDSPSVVIAHKHRGKAATSSVLIEELLQGDCSSKICHEPNSATPSKLCQWANWCVTRAARLGKVDFLLLTRKTGSQTHS